MKFHNNAFGRRERKTVFLSFLAAATAFQLTSCAEIPELPPSEQIYSSQTEIVTTLSTETSTETTAETTAETTSPQNTAPEIDPAPAEKPSETEESAQTEAEKHIRTEISEEIVTDAYQTRYEYSSEYDKGVRFERQAGVDGKRKITTVTTYEDDVLVDVSRTEETLTARADAIVVIGMKVVRTEKTETLVGGTVPFQTRYVYDDTRYEDERTVLKAGKNGYTLYTDLVTYENGVEVLRERISESVFPPVSEEIRVGTKPVKTVTTETVREDTIAYTTRYEYDDTLDDGVRKLKTAGKDGYTEKTYEITYHKGTESARKVIAEKTVAPVEEVILVGTKKEERYYMPFRDAAHGGNNYAVTQSYSSSHRALDFGVWYGEPILAIKSGTVIAAYNEGYYSTDNILWTYGTYVVIEHEDGMRSYYAHLKSKTVSVGQRVSGGQVIGYSGNTGRVNPAPSANDPLAGTHLHFEIRIKQGSAYVTTDPRKYLPYWN